MVNTNITWEATEVKIKTELYDGDTTIHAHLVGHPRSASCDTPYDIRFKLQNILNKEWSKDEEYWSAPIKSGPDPWEEMLRPKTNPNPNLAKQPKPITIKKVIFSDPATIVFWSDDTKTVVKAQNGEPFDPEKGLAMAVTKRCLGNKGNYFNTISEWTEKYDGPSSHSAIWCAYHRLLNALGDKKATKSDLIQAMEEAVGYLGEALGE